MSSDLLKNIFKAILGFLALITIPLLQAEGQVCEKNAESGINECAPHNMLYVIFWNLSNFFDHHEGTVIGVATIFLALITAFLWDATRDLVVGAEIAAERQQRAYIGVESILLDCPSAKIPNYKPSPAIAGANVADFVVLNIKNFGATPANKVYTWVNWYSTPFPLALPLDFGYPDWSYALPDRVGVEPIETTLFPTQTYASKVAMPDVTPLILSNTRMVFLYFYGRIVYTDITNTERFTYFCFRHLAGRQPDSEMERYRDHNTAT